MTALDPVPTRIYKAGTLLVRENELARSMFIIRKGQARVFRSYLGQPITLAIIGPGEVFGEMSFIDGEPRSASVEALTDIAVVVIEGEQGARHLKELPEWVWGVLRTVFHRFREMDQKLTVLQSVNEFRKKNMRMNTVASAIFHEILRFNRTMLLLYERDLDLFGRVDGAKLSKEMDDILGVKFIGLRVYFKILREHHFIRGGNEASGNTRGQPKFQLDVRAFQAFDTWLSAEVAKGEYHIFSHTALAIMRRIIETSALNGGGAEGVAGGVKEITLKGLRVESIALCEKAVKELRSKAILHEESDTVAMGVGEIANLYAYQSVVKAFDHSVIVTD